MCGSGSARRSGFSREIHRRSRFFYKSATSDATGNMGQSHKKGLTRKGKAFFIFWTGDRG